MDALAWSSVKTFYPNMSKFFQERFGFTNVEAGNISSIPNVVSVLAVPLIGIFFSKRPPINGFLASLIFVFFAELSYLMMPGLDE